MIPNIIPLLIVVVSSEQEVANLSLKALTIGPNKEVINHGQKDRIHAKRPWLWLQKFMTCRFKVMKVDDTP